MICPATAKMNSILLDHWPLLWVVGTGWALAAFSLIWTSESNEESIVLQWQKVIGLKDDKYLSQSGMSVWKLFQQMFIGLKKELLNISTNLLHVARNVGEISTTQKSFESSSEPVSQQVAKHNITFLGHQSIKTMTF